MGMDPNEAGRHGGGSGRGGATGRGNIVIRTTGIGELRAKLASLAEVAQSEVILKAARKTMQPLAEATAEAYPRSGGEKEYHYSGHLADTIRVFTLGPRSQYAPVGEGAAVAVSYDKAMFWGHMVERGTVKMRANPVFARTFEALRDTINPRFAALMEKEIQRKLKVTS